MRQPTGLYPEILLIVQDAEKRVRDLVRMSKELQGKRKRAATADEVDDEGDGEEAGRVHDGIVGNPHTKAKGAGRPQTKRIRNTGDGARRKGRKVTDER